MSCTPFIAAIIIEATRAGQAARIGVVHTKASLDDNLASLVMPSVALIGSKVPMTTEHQSPPPQVPWPVDLRVFAVLAALWALCLMVSVFVHGGEIELADPVETIFAGVRFNGDQARLVLVV